MEMNEQENSNQEELCRDVETTRLEIAQTNTPVESENKEQSELLMDFSSMFKTTSKKKPFKPLGQRQEENKPNNWLLEIPVKVDTTLDDLKFRKVFDLRRWYCIIRLESQSLSAVMSIFNYLFSHKGTGTTEPIVSLEAIEGSPEQQFEFLCNHSGLKAKSRRLKENIQKELTSGLKSTNKAYIYCSENQYLCPVGFEYTPSKPLEAYKKEINLQEAQLWLILAETSKQNPVFSVKKWKDVKIEENQHFFLEFQKFD